MGWTFSRQTRDQLICELVKPDESKRARIEVVAHTLCGNVLWSVVRITAKQTGTINLTTGESTCYIRCDLLEGSGGEWGYKPLEESQHPYYYSCPLPYLDMAPAECPEWRDQVRAYHQQRREQRQRATPTVTQSRGDR